MYDGNNYNNANTARDRNILQGQVLESLGWTIYRLWILDWFENPDAELMKIDTAVKMALEKPKAEILPVTNNITAVFSKLEREDKASNAKENIKYQICGIENITLGADEFCSSVNNKAIIEQIENVLQTEAPISKNLLCKRILAAWNISRMGSRLERRFQEIFSIAKLNNTKQGNEVFYWDKNQTSSKYELFRVPKDDATRRNIEDICQEELSNAVKYILQNQISLSREDLIKEVYKLFGFSRGNSAIEKNINEGIDMAVNRDYAFIDDAHRVVIK